MARWSRPGKLDTERRPPARRAFNRDGAAHRSRVLAHDPEAEPESAASLPSAELSELFKDSRLVLGRDPRPPVTHSQQGPITVVLDDHLDRRPARMRERVDEKVRQDLVQAHRVPTADDRTIGANLELAPAEPGRGGETFDDLARQRRQIHLLPLDRGQGSTGPRHVEPVLDQPTEPPAAR